MAFATALINVVIDMSTAANYNITGRWLANTTRITNTSSFTNSNIFCFWCSAVSSNRNAITTSWRGICCPADSRHAAPGQGTGRKGYGDDAG